MNILLICALGMSSSLIEAKIKAVAVERGLELTLNAISLPDVTNYRGEHFDCVLIAPQMRYAADNIKEQLGDEPAYCVMGVTDYGMIKAAKILDDALAAIEEKKNQ